MRGITNASGQGVSLNADTETCVIADGNTITAGDFVEDYHALTDGVLFTYNIEDTKIFKLSDGRYISIGYYAQVFERSADGTLSINLEPYLLGVTYGSFIELGNDKFLHLYAKGSVSYSSSKQYTHKLTVYGDIVAFDVSTNTFTKSTITSNVYTLGTRTGSSATISEVGSKFVVRSDGSLAGMHVYTYYGSSYCYNFSAISGTLSESGGVYSITISTAGYSTRTYSDSDSRYLESFGINGTRNFATSGISSSTSNDIDTWITPTSKASITTTSLYYYVCGLGDDALFTYVSNNSLYIRRLAIDESNNYTWYTAQEVMSGIAYAEGGILLKETDDYVRIYCSGLNTTTSGSTAKTYSCLVDVSKTDGSVTVYPYTTRASLYYENCSYVLSDSEFWVGGRNPAPKYPLTDVHITDANELTGEVSTVHYVKSASGTKFLTGVAKDSGVGGDSIAVYIASV